MQSWVKLHCCFNQSSISRCSYPTRLVWVSLLSICRMDAIVAISDDRVAATCNVTEEEAAEAIKTLSSPDPHSKDPEFEGRRIEKCVGGYRILNYFKYRDIRSPAKKSAYMRDYMKNYRKKKKEGLTWQEVYKMEADDAMTLPIPAAFGPDVEEAIINFLNMRYAMATEPKVKNQSVRLSSAMAKALFEETAVALITLNPQEVASKLRSAAISGYKSPRFNALYR